MKTFVVVLLMMLPGIALAQVNKCLDASGKTVAYGADCPPGTRSEQTAIRNNPATSKPAEKSIAEREADFRKRQVEKQEAEAKSVKSTAESAQRKQACNDSQAYLKTLQGGHRIRTTDPKTGERSYLADADYAKEIARSEKAIAANCK